ncbi:sensor histidine kinase, partial [Cyanobacteria bacterium FACHB-63]|nr:sensor histidine kinase [Cyanobacteria bacterium FACHB-63]
RSMDQLLNDLMAIGRVEGGSLKFSPAPLDLEQFCQRLVEEIQFSFGTHQRLVFHCQGNCEQAYLDQKLLRHTLTNLLSNAIKYSPEGGLVYFDLVCTDEQITMQVRDTGIGIPPETQRHLFEPFHRASNVGKIPGTGLGLTMVKRCVDLQGGQITVESEVDVGTTFIIQLPQHQRVAIRQERIVSG